MARLNMLPAPTDNMGLDRLRRKFAEQNQVLVKSNARQSLQIQKLNNECARLLSENLDLRGHILRLEKDLQDNRARRIADHALEVKSRLEEQLLELTSTLAGLGVEPSRKRHSSPSRRKMAKPRKSLSATSPPRKSSRDLPQDSEALAFREGRLPPIQENKSYPRATLNAEEIMALCEEAEDTTDSLDLGPPPVSRYVDEVVETDSPSKKIIEKVEKITEPVRPAPPAKTESGRKPTKESPLRSEDPIIPPATEAKSDKENVPLASSLQASRGGKRKFGDEIEPGRATKPLPGKENNRKESQEKAASACDKQRSIKELPPTRRERPHLAPGTTRKPLSVKHSNEDLSSPKKATKPLVFDEVASSKTRALKESLSKERLSSAKSVPRIEIPEPEAPPMVTILPDPQPLLPDIVMVSPDTPNRSAPRDPARDTPPPADISSNGETSRPSRRARALVSYAEPNLRDKMRRPSKQLLDAVAGEGKYTHRPQKSDDLSSSSSKPHPGPVDGLNESAAEALAKEAARRETMRSPLAEKRSPVDVFPVNVSTEQRKRPSNSSRESLASLALDKPKSTCRTLKAELPKVASNAAKDVAAKKDHSSDVYEFSSSSPMAEPKEQPRESETKSRPSSRNPRKSSTPLNKYTSVETIQATAKSRSSSLRKRASMVEPEKTLMVDSTDPDESMQEREEGPCGVSARDRISRRRSMML